MADSTDAGTAGKPQPSQSNARLVWDPATDPSGRPFKGVAGDWIGASDEGWKHVASPAWYRSEGFQLPAQLTPGDDLTAAGPDGQQWRIEVLDRTFTRATRPLTSAELTAWRDHKLALRVVSMSSVRWEVLRTVCLELQAVAEQPRNQRRVRALARAARRALFENAMPPSTAREILAKVGVQRPGFDACAA